MDDCACTEGAKIIMSDAVQSANASIANVIFLKNIFFDFTVRTRKIVFITAECMRFF
jgi:hypothetical protein